MKSPTILLLAPLLFTAALSACAHHARRTPDFSTRAPTPRPAQKGLLQRTGDVAWDVVSAPVRLIAPHKKTASAKEEPDTYEPADAVILYPPGFSSAASPGDPPVAASQPAP